MVVVVVTTGAIRRAKLQSNCHLQQTQHKNCYSPDAPSVVQPTLSKHLREKFCTICVANFPYNSHSENVNKWAWEVCLTLLHISTRNFFLLNSKPNGIM